MINILYLHAGAELYGADIILYNIVKNLDKSKFTLYVILPNDGPLVEKIRSAGVYCEVVGYPILRRKYFNPKGIVYYTLEYTSKCKEIIRKLDDVKIDIIHNNTAAVLEGIYLKKKMNAKLIVHCHEIIKKPKFMNTFYAKVFSKCADLTICVSNAVKDNLETVANFNGKINVCYNGIDNTIFNPNYDTKDIRNELNIPQDSLVVGMLGRVNAWKGQGDFLQAIEQIGYKENIYYVLIGGVFAGEEWRMDELKEKVEKSPMHENIRLVDFRPDSYRLHNMLDVFVLPSTSPDPLPTVVLEAMASGNPVIGYRHGGVCEMCVDGKTGLLANVCEPIDLASKIDKLIDDKALRDNMGAAALERQHKEFSQEAQMRNLCDIYEFVGGNKYVVAGKSF